MTVFAIRTDLVVGQSAEAQQSNLAATHHKINYRLLLPTVPTTMTALAQGTPGSSVGSPESAYLPRDGTKIHPDLPEDETEDGEPYREKSGNMRLSSRGECAFLHETYRPERRPWRPQPPRLLSFPSGTSTSPVPALHHRCFNGEHARATATPRQSHHLRFTGNGALSGHG